MLENAHVLIRQIPTATFVEPLSATVATANWYLRVSEFYLGHPKPRMSGYIQTFTIVRKCTRVYSAEPCCHICGPAIYKLCIRGLGGSISVP